MSQIKNSTIKEVIQDAVDGIRSQYRMDTIMHGKTIEHISVYKKKEIVAVYWGASAPEKAQAYIDGKLRS